MADLAEIFGGPADDPIPVGIRVGDLIHGLRVAGADPATGAPGEGIESQIRHAFAAMRASAEAAGAGLANVGLVSAFFADVRASMPAFNALWVETFPDDADRPTYKFMAAPLPAGRLVQLEYFAVRGGRRSVVNIPGVAHTNPIPMASRVGAYLFTSRVLPFDPADGKPGEGAARQAELAFANAATVLETAGMGWGDVVQGRAFVAEDGDRPLVARLWAERTAGAPAPVLHMTRYRVAPTLLVMLELIAVEAGA